MIEIQIIFFPIINYCVIIIMASIRRTLSPAYHHSNGIPPFSVSSPSHKHLLIPNGKYTSPLFLPFSKLLRKTTSFRNSFFRIFLSFLLGSLFAISPFGTQNDDVTSHHFSFEINKSPPFDQLVIKNSVTEIEPKYDDFETETRPNNDLVTPKRQLIIITPTYSRALQAYYLNRLGQTIRLVGPPLLWIVVEMESASSETAEVLRKSGVMYRHLVCKRNSSSSSGDEFKDRGVRQRNVALEHIERHRLDGIVYFADDDNIYSLELFGRLRDIRRFGTWPVAMLAPSKNKATLEGPVCNASQVIGWHTNEKSKRLRRFHVDMSGFAFNSTILWDPKRWGRPLSTPIRQLDSVKEGFQETTFIEQVVEDESQMEGTPSGCSRIMTWHLHLDVRDLVYPNGWVLQKNLDAVLPVS